LQQHLNDKMFAIWFRLHSIVPFSFNNSTHSPSRTYVEQA
jgi:hypothetical protein